MNSNKIILLSVVFIGTLCHCLCNIHRAVPGSPGYHQIPIKVRKSGIIIEEDDDDDELQNLGYFDRIYLKASIAWLYAIPAAMLVGSTGIFPLLIFKVDEGHELKEAISPSNLKLLLSFAVGGLLGDVFLHLLPESWMYLDKNSHDHVGGLKIGLWVLAGLLCFLILEKVFFEEEKVKEQIEKQEALVIEKLLVATAELNKKKKKEVDDTNGTSSTVIDNKTRHRNNKGNIGEKVKTQTNNKRKDEEEVKDLQETSNTKHTVEPGDVDDPPEFTEEHIKEKGTSQDVDVKNQVIGYLNLLANCIDNFTHGLAVAGSFIVSTPVGICTTIAILLHEIPHEIGDFAILLKAGFKRWDAAKGQMLTASGAVIGCLFGLLAEGAGDSSAWVLPFTSGGFIYIALVTVVPDLLKEDNVKESMKQIAFLLLGLGTMGVVSLLH